MWKSSEVLISADFKYLRILTYIKINKWEKELARNGISYCEVIIIINLSGMLNKWQMSHSLADY